ncbi:MAG: hypothetical protein JW986_05885 [Methanotrichaceae archaeon]|nr:hypothetical protein [Methanotrichaceae archaeon]
MRDVGDEIRIKSLEYGKIDQSHILIVEGIDDAEFFKSYLEYISSSDIEIWPIGGKTRLTKALGALKMLSGFSRVISLGIIRDADDDAAGAFQSVCDSLSRNGLPAPDRIGRPSLCSPPIVRVMILPDGQKPGMLETLCMESVRDDKIMPCIDRFFECAKDPVHQPPQMDKARLQVYLASRMEPGKRLGESANSGYWKFDDKAFDDVKRFLIEVSNP